MRVHATSRGLDPSVLVPGEDLLLEIDDAHGLETPDGVLVTDYLPVEDRWGVDIAAVEAAARWHAAHDEALTLDGICLPEIWRFQLHEIMVPAIVRAEGLRRAVVAHRPKRLVQADEDPDTAALIGEVGERLGLAVQAPASGDVRSTGPTAGRRRREPLGRRIRSSVLRFGAPTRLRSGSVLVMSYWPLMPMLDRMLEEDGWRPAITLERRPARPTRSLRAAARGGWVGLPSPGRVRRAAERVEQHLRVLDPAPQLEALGLPIGASVQRRVLALARARGGMDLAAAALLRSTLGSGRIRQVVATYDLEPYARTLITLAREAGVPTLCVAHGAYVLPQPVADLELADQVALWSEHLIPPFSPRGRPIHVIGYPLPNSAPAARTLAGRDPPRRILVLGHTGAPSTALVDRRIGMRSWDAALRAIGAVTPGAAVVLRPHPSQTLPPMDELASRYPDVSLELDVATDAVELLGASDLCLGGASAATLQSALVGTPAVVVNLSGFDWPWPLGGDTSVPIAHSEAELRDVLARWAGGEPMPGREDLLEGLGAHGADAAGRLLELLEADSGA